MHPPLADSILPYEANTAYQILLITLYCTIFGKLLQAEAILSFFLLKMYKKAFGDRGPPGPPGRGETYGQSLTGFKGTFSRYGREITEKSGKAGRIVPLPPITVRIISLWAASNQCISTTTGFNSVCIRHKQQYQRRNCNGNKSSSYSKQGRSLMHRWLLLRHCVSDIQKIR